MSSTFESYVQKGYEFINSIANELEIGDKDRVIRITKCVLHALRSRITVAESTQLIAQLPMAIKALYVDGWSNPEKVKKIRNQKDFINEIIRNDGMAAWRDFSSEEEAEKAAHAVFNTLNKYVSEGEMEDIMTQMPKGLRTWIKEF